MQLGYVVGIRAVDVVAGTLPVNLQALEQLTHPGQGVQPQPGVGR
jgi:hypothetical protein